jgi:predicted phosphodiesterase
MAFNEATGIWSRVPELDEYVATQRQKKGLEFTVIAKMATELYRIPITPDAVRNRLVRIGKAEAPNDAFAQRQKEIDAILASLPQKKREQLRATLTGMLPVMKADEKTKEDEDEEYLIPEKHRAPKRYAAITDKAVYRVVTISDLHWPDQNDMAVAAFTRFMEDVRPDLLILNGDIFNGSALCGYAKTCRREKRDMDIGKEIETARPTLQAWIDAAGAAVYVGGNHDVDRMERLLAREASGLAYDVNKIWYLMMERHGYKDIKFFDPELRGSGRLLWVGTGEDAVGHQHGHVYPRHTAWKNLTEQWPGKNTAQGHTHRPQLFFHRDKFCSVGGHMLDVRRMMYMPNEDWTMGFQVFDFFADGTRVNPSIVKMHQDGQFVYNGKVYTS